MIFSTTGFVLFHVALSLIGIATGFVVLASLLKGQTGGRLTAVFLATTLATTLTGFLFPLNGFTPAIGTGIVSLIVLGPAIAALYACALKGVWRKVYVLGAIIALYLNVFVLVVQAFQKVPVLHALAPNGSEPPFAAAQGLVLLGFVAAGFLSLKRTRTVAA